MSDYNLRENPYYGDNVAEKGLFDDVEAASYGSQNYTYDTSPSTLGNYTGPSTSSSLPPFVCFKNMEHNTNSSTDSSMTTNSTQSNMDYADFAADFTPTNFLPEDACEPQYGKPAYENVEVEVAEDQVGSTSEHSLLDLTSRQIFDTSSQPSEPHSQNLKRQATSTTEVQAKIKKDLCTKKFTCPVPEHNRMGIFAHEHAEQKFFPQFIHILLMIGTFTSISTLDEGQIPTLSCLLCLLMTNMSYQEAYNHILAEHGKELGHIVTKYGVAKKIKELLNKRRIMFPHYPLQMICATCHKTTVGFIDTVIHSCKHTHIEEQIKYCPEPYCLLPLYDDNVERHYTSWHGTKCCHTKITSIQKYINHQLECHKLKFMSTTTNMLEFLELSNNPNATNLLWKPTIPLAMALTLVNQELPNMYSDRFSIRMAETNNDQFLNLLVPNNIGQEYIDKFRGNLNLDLKTIIRDIIAQSKFNEYICYLTSRLIEWPIDAYQSEIIWDIGEGTELGLKCHTCMDTREHRDTFRCIPGTVMFPATYSTITDLISAADWTRIHYIWATVTSSPMSKLPHTTFCGLNIHTQHKNVKTHETSYYGQPIIGKPCALTHVFWYDCLKNILGQLPKNTYVPIFIQTIYELENLCTEERMIEFAYNHFFIVTKLRELFLVPIVTLGPFPACISRLNKEDYLSLVKKCTKLTNIMTLIANKTHSMILPLMGTVFSIQKDPINQPGLWTTLTMKCDEKLVSNNLLFTRETSHRIGALVTKMIIAIMAANRKSPFITEYWDKIEGPNKKYYLKYVDAQEHLQVQI